LGGNATRLVLADSRRSSDSTERPLTNTERPSQRERQQWAVEPPVVAMDRTAVPDPQQAGT